VVGQATSILGSTRVLPTMTSNHRCNCEKVGTIANLCSCDTINSRWILALKTPQYGKRSITLRNIACQLNTVTWICFALKSKWSYVWQNCSTNYGESYSLSIPQTTLDYALVRSSTLTVKIFYGIFSTKMLIQYHFIIWHHSMNHKEDYYPQKHVSHSV